MFSSSYYLKIRASESTRTVLFLKKGLKHNQRNCKWRILNQASEAVCQQWDFWSNFGFSDVKHIPSLWSNQHSDIIARLPQQLQDFERDFQSAFFPLTLMSSACTADILDAYWSKERLVNSGLDCYNMLQRVSFKYPPSISIARGKSKSFCCSCIFMS